MSHIHTDVSWKSLIFFLSNDPEAVHKQTAGRLWSRADFKYGPFQFLLRLEVITSGSINICDCVYFTWIWFIWHSTHSAFAAHEESLTFLTRI